MSSPPPSQIRHLHAESVIDTVREPLLLLDANLHIVMANAAFYRVFGLAGEDVVGRHLFEISNGAWSDARLRHLLEDVLPTDTQFEDFEASLDLPGAGRRVVLLNARRLQHTDENVALILLAFEDVTERHRLRAEIQSTLEALRHSNVELEEFASIASHDLQEPLRKIRTFGERLETVCRDDLSDLGRDYLRRMTTAAERMQRLIDDLLALARLRLAAPTWTAVDLAEVVTNVLGEFDDAIRTSSATVDVGALPTIEADATQMHQLLRNLIGNALKFRQRHPPRIGVHAVRLSDGAWEVMVDDDGMGFDQKHAVRMFRPFERLHGRTEFAGSGVGLAICERIVTRHGGQIRAEGRPGEGARFLIRLPATQGS